MTPEEMIVDKLKKSLSDLKASRDRARSWVAFSPIDDLAEDYEAINEMSAEIKRIEDILKVN